MLSFQAHTNLHRIEVLKKKKSTPLLRLFYILNQKLFTDSHLKLSPVKDTQMRIFN